MGVILIANQIMYGKISEDSIPASLRERVHEVLVTFGYYD